MYHFLVLVKIFFTKIYRNWSNRRLEFRYLSDLTGKQKYWKEVEPIEGYLDAITDLEMFERTHGQDLPIQAKAYIQATGRSGADRLFSIHSGTIEKMIDSGHIASTPLLSLYYVTRNLSSSSLKVESHVAYCSYGAMFALDSLEQSDPDAKELLLNIAKGITETCHLMATSSRTALPFEEFTIDDSVKSPNQAFTGSGGYALVPHLAESYFVLYRLTREQKYRDYAWDLARSIFRHARTSFGFYAPVMNVKRAEAPKGNDQPPVFLSGTLKFLYLTFSPLKYVNIDSWVFTPSGHPLPICGRNRAYPSSRCK